MVMFILHLSINIYIKYKHFYIKYIILNIYIKNVHMEGIPYCLYI